MLADYPAVGLMSLWVVQAVILFTRRGCSLFPPCRPPRIGGATNNANYAMGSSPPTSGVMIEMTCEMG